MKGMLAEASLLFRLKQTTVTEIRNRFQTELGLKYENEFVAVANIKPYVWERAKGLENRPLLKFEAITDLCVAINGSLNWKRTYSEFCQQSLPRNIAAMQPSQAALPLWQEFCQWVRQSPDPEFRKTKHFDTAVRRYNKEVHSQPPKAKAPRGVQLWDTGDHAPANLQKGETASNERPKRRFLRQGKYAIRTDLYSRLFSSLESFLSPEDSKAEDSETVGDDRLSVFWIGGPSGSGKSVALLFSLSHLVTDARFTVTSIRNIDKLQLLLEWWLSTEPDNEAKLVIGIDDPYSPNFPDRKSVWQNFIEMVEDAYDEFGPVAVPHLIACGPTEQLREFIRNDVTQMVDVREETLPRGTRSEVRELSKWYAGRKGCSLPSVPIEDVAIVQLFWEWQHGPLKQFASNLVLRIADFDQRERGQTFDIFASVLAFNRIYIAFPSVLIEELPSRNCDFMHRLQQELMYDGGGGSQRETGVWLMHPHLAGRVYEEWVEAWQIGDAEQTSHLVGQLSKVNLAAVRQIEKTETLRSFLQAILTASGSVQSLPWNSIWQAIHDLYSSWSDHNDGENRLTTSLPAWIEFRLTAVLPEAHSYFVPDPVKVAIKLANELPRNAPLLPDLLETLAYNAVRTGPQFRVKIGRSVYDHLKKNHRLKGWARIAYSLLRNTKHEKPARLAVAWLHNMPSSTSGWSDLWKMVASTYYEYGKEHPDAGWVLKSLVDLGAKNENHNAWPHVWRHAWNLADADDKAELRKSGFSWLIGGAAPDSKWNYVWWSIKSDGLIDDVHAEMLLKRFQSTSGWHSAWDRVWEHAMLNIDSQSLLSKLWEVTATKKITQARWPSNLRLVVKKTTNEELKIEIIEFCKNWIYTNSVCAQGWGSIFGIVWEIADDSDRECLWCHAVHYLQLSQPRRQSFSSWANVWKRCFGQLSDQHVDWQRSMIRMAANAFSTIHDPVHTGSCIRSVFDKLASSDSHGETTRDELTLWIEDNPNSFNWKYIWQPLFAREKAESKSERITQITLRWLETAAMTGDWMDVFKQVVDSLAVRQLSESIIWRALEILDQENLDTSRQTGFVTYCSRLLPEWLSEVQPTDPDSFSTQLEKGTFQLVQSMAFEDPQWPFCWLNAVRSCQTNAAFQSLTQMGVKWLSVAPQHAHRDRLVKKLLEISTDDEYGLKTEQYALSSIANCEPDDAQYLLYSILVRQQAGHATEEFLDVARQWIRRYDPEHLGMLKRRVKAHAEEQRPEIPEDLNVDKFIDATGIE